MLIQELTWKHSGFVWFICFEVSISWESCRCYFRWYFLQGRGEEEQNLSPALLSIPSPLLQHHRQLQMNPVLQPHGRWIHRDELPWLLLSRTAEQEQEVPGSRAPNTYTCQRGSKLSHDSLSLERHRKYLGKLDRHQLTRGWEQQGGGDMGLSQTRWQLKYGSCWYCCEREIVAATQWLFWPCFGHRFSFPFLLHRV